MTVATDPIKLTIFAGIPGPSVDLVKMKADGRRIVLFLTPEEAKSYIGPIPDNAFIWGSDAGVHSYLFEHLNDFIGAEIAEATRAQKLAMILKDIVELHNFDQHSMEVLGLKSEPMKNMMQNFRWVQDGLPLRRFKNVGKDAKHSALVIAAGPSLNYQWQAIAQIRATDPNVTVLCVGRSYAKAVSEGIIPDFVLEAEQYEFDAGIWNFAPRPQLGIILACPLSVNPLVMKAWPVEKMALVDHTTAQIHGMELGVDSLDGGNSVAHLCFNLAVHLGCNPIVMAGVDLGYGTPTCDTHADGVFPEAWPNQILRAEHARQQELPGDAWDGSSMQTSPAYKNFGALFTSLAQKARKTAPALKCYSVSPRGLKILGFEYLDLKEWGKWNSAPSSPASSPSVASSSASGSLLDAPYLSTLALPINGTPLSPIKKELSGPVCSTLTDSQLMRPRRKGTKKTR